MPASTVPGGCTIPGGNPVIARLRDIAVALNVTERTAYGIVVDLTAAGYVAKNKDGRRNRYDVQAHLPLRDSIGRQRAVGELVSLFVDAKDR